MALPFISLGKGSLHCWVAHLVIIVEKSSVNMFTIKLIIYSCLVFSVDSVMGLACLPQPALPSSGRCQPLRNAGFCH